MPDFIIDCICTGSRGNCWAVDYNGDIILFDLGLSFRQLQRAVDVSRIKGVFVSHRHGDHWHESTETSLTRRLRGGWLEYSSATLVGHDVPNLAFKVSGGDVSVAYITDTPDLIDFGPITHLIIECNHDKERLLAGDLPADLRIRISENHMSLDRCIETIRINKKNGKLEEVWLGHTSDQHGDADEYREIIRREFPGLRIFHGAIDKTNRNK